MGSPPLLDFERATTKASGAEGAPPAGALTTSISIAKCSLLAFSFWSFSRLWYSTCEGEGAERKWQGV